MFEELPNELTTDQVLLTEILAELRKLTAALEKAMPLLDNPAAKWAGKLAARRAVRNTMDPGYRTPEIMALIHTENDQAGL